MRIAMDVRAALDEGQPVVALESTVLTHGLPRPTNLEVARDLEAVVRAEAAVPATVAVLDGVAMVGLDEGQLRRIATQEPVAKLGGRDLPVALATGATGGTTVAATALLAARAGIGIMATGGLGGVHREARHTWDESADLTTLARTAIAVVCSGVKSVLDVPATLERLETLNVTVVGYHSHRFPGFYVTHSEHPLEWSVDTPAEVAGIIAARQALGLASGIVVANPVPPDQQLDPGLHDAALRSGLEELARRGIRGKAVTPFLLEWIARVTAGASVEANRALLRANARLAARVAAALTRRSPGT